MAAISSIRLLVVSGSPPETSRSLSPVRRSAAQPPGPGFPRHAPSVNISTSGSSLTSGNELARELEDHALRNVSVFRLDHLEPFPKRLDDLADQHFRSGCAGGNPDGAGLTQPIPVDLPRPFDQPR